MPYNERYKGNIADSLTPTIENVVREFTTNTMRDILLDNKKVNFNFVFEQPDSINFIIKIFEKYIAEYYSGFGNEANKIIEALKQGNERNNALPSLIISDYQSFFELLRQYYEKDIELFFKRTHASSFMVYEMKNCFEQIWLRATPEDFNNPEQFLQKQVQFINNTTFSKYDNETVVGSPSCFDEHILCVKNGIARTWDETPHEFQITLYDKEYYHRTELFNRPHYTLPLIRYGIYNKNGKKVCLIGSIQSRKNETSEKVVSFFNRTRYKVNKDVPYYKDIIDAEPSHLIALSIFVNFLHNEGITEIEAPSFYTLDYQYHQKANITLMDKFQNEWTEYEQKQFPERYAEEKQQLEKYLNKEDLISEGKTERFIETFMRLIYHYPKSEIQSYAGELDNYLHLSIPVVQTENDINGDFLKEMYLLVNEIYPEKKNGVER